MSSVYDKNKVKQTQIYVNSGAKAASDAVLNRAPNNNSAPPN